MLHRYGQDGRQRSFRHRPTRDKSPSRDIPLASSRRANPCRKQSVQRCCCRTLVYRPGSLGLRERHHQRHLTDNIRSRSSRDSSPVRSVPLPLRQPHQLTPTLPAAWTAARSRLFSESFGRYPSPTPYLPPRAPLWDVTLRQGSSVMHRWLTLCVGPLGGVCGGISDRPFGAGLRGERRVAWRCDV